MRLGYTAFFLIVLSLAGCGGGGSSDAGGTTTPPPGPPPDPVTINGGTFDPATSRGVDDSSFGLYTSQSFTLVGYGEEAGMDATYSFSDSENRGVPCRRLTIDDAGDVDWFDLAVDVDGNIQVLSWLGAATETPRILYPAVLEVGTTWVGGLYDEDSTWEVISMSCDSPQGESECIQIRCTAIYGGDFIEDQYIVPGYGIVDQVVDLTGDTSGKNRPFIPVGGG